MPLSEHQNLIRFIETVSGRIGTCENQTDRAIFAIAINYLIDLSIRQSKELN